LDRGTRFDRGAVSRLGFKDLRLNDQLDDRFTLLIGLPSLEPLDRTAFVRFGEGLAGLNDDPSAVALALTQSIDVFAPGRAAGLSGSADSCVLLGYGSLGCRDSTTGQR